MSSRIHPLTRGARPWLSLVLALGLAACQVASTTTPNAAVATATPAADDATKSPEPAATAATDEPTPQASEPAFTVDPVTVSPALDAAHAVGQVIGPDGGTLMAAGADGALFSLTIPPASLIAPLVITLTPVSALDNLPLSGGLAAGVQLEPEGLWLVAPATLVITPAQTLAPESQDFFAYRGAGVDWHAYPPVTSTAALALSIQHFSGYGVGSGSDADRAQQTGHAPTDQMAQIEATIAEIFRQEKATQQKTGHGDPDFYDRLNAQIVKAFNQVVQPTAEAALESDDYDVIAGAIKVMLSWERFAALVDPDTLAPEMGYTTTVMEELVLHAVEIAGQECTEQHNYVRLLTLFGLERTMALLGSSGVHSALDKMRACLHFELTFVSVITEGGFGDPYGYRYELKGTVALAVPDGDEALIKGRLVGTGPLTYVSVSWIGEQSCTWATGGDDAVLNLLDGVNGVPFPFAPNAATVEITYDPGLPAENVTMSCPKVDPLTWHTTAWKGYFDIMHAPEKVESSYRLVTPMLGGDIIARSQQHLTTQGPSGQEVIEDTLIQIVHKP